MRILDLFLVEPPDIGPEPGILEELGGDIPQGIALPDGVIKSDFILVDILGFTTGNITYLWICLGGFAVYVVFSVVSYLLLAGKKSFAKTGQVWYRG